MEVGCTGPYETGHGDTHAYLEGAATHRRGSAHCMDIYGVNRAKFEGRYESGVLERFEISVGRGGGVSKWTGVGTCPHWYGGGLCVTRFTWVRDGDFGKVPRCMREIGRRDLFMGEMNRVEREAREEREREGKRVEKRRCRFFGIS